jgi:hypothetical protein
MRGISRLQDITNTTPTPIESLEYLTRNIRYGLGEPEKAALTLFATLAIRHGLLKNAPALHWV